MPEPTVTSDAVETILVVEDDQGVAYLQSRALTRAGYDVIVAASQTEALESVRAERIALAVMDYRLSGTTTGLDVYEEWKSAGHDIPVIMVTGFSDEATIVSALRSGVRDFLLKSTEYLAYLPKAVERVLQQTRLEAALRDSEARLRCICDSAMDAILAINEHGRIVSWNRRAEQMFGYSTVEATGRRFTLLASAERRRELLRRFRENKEFPETSVESMGRRRNGSEFPIEASIGSWTTDGHAYFGVIVRDITRRRQSEQAIRQRDRQLRQAHEETVHRLVAASMCRDEETGAHIRRTGILSELLARASGWSHADAEHLRMAAPMHDVGKIGIPDAILRKPATLTPAEYETMKQHTVIGARMLTGSASPVLQLAQSVALSHHEAWDGSGYPYGLAGEEIPESARIVAIVDVYDALSHDRIYRPAMTEEAVLAHLQAGSGTQFDPGLLATFFGIFEEIREACCANPDVADRLDISPIGMAAAPYRDLRCELEPINRR